LSFSSWMLLENFGRVGLMEQIDYRKIIGRHPWIVERNHKCILSPDCDGLLCGLFMSHYLNWEIRGFYDGKVLLLDKNTSTKDCVFLDMEVFRKEVRSVGHHMVLFNKNKKPSNWDNFANCIQPNNLRNHDGYKDFRSKYPLATIHLLIGIVAEKLKVEIPKSAICPLFYVNGVFKNLFGYPENCLDWLRYLKANDKKSKLRDIFLNEHYSIYNLMVALKDFFVQLENLSSKRLGNDKVKISSPKGEAVNVVKRDDVFDLEQQEREKVEAFLKILSELTGWNYKIGNWQWSNFCLKTFSKKSIRPNNRNFEAMMKKKPITWAMTSRAAIEYTLDPRNKLLE
jgi:hypothetical protein